MKQNKLIRGVSYIDTGAFVITSGLLVILTVFGVIKRYVAHDPLTWLEELQMILIVQASFFGASIAFRERGHVCVDLLVDMFPPKLKKAVEIFAWLLVLAALGLIGWQEGLRTVAQIQNGRVSNILRIPMYLNYAGVTLATILMIINHVAIGIEDFIIGKEKKNDDQ